MTKTVSRSTYSACAGLTSDHSHRVECGESIPPRGVSTPTPAKSHGRRKADAIDQIARIRRGWVIPRATSERPKRNLPLNHSGTNRIAIRIRIKKYGVRPIGTPPSTLSTDAAWKADKRIAKGPSDSGRKKKIAKPMGITANPIGVTYMEFLTQAPGH